MSRFQGLAEYIEGLEAEVVTLRATNEKLANRLQAIVDLAGKPHSETPRKTSKGKTRFCWALDRATGEVRSFTNGNSRLTWLAGNDGEKILNSDPRVVAFKAAKGEAA